jgi:outer membrane protein assembly factor BamA
MGGHERVACPGDPSRLPQWRVACRHAIGAGVGVRYYTGFGPLRFDVAVPLNEKEDLDQNYQFYISIGQAF